jgi:hypothetical protein
VKKAIAVTFGIALFFFSLYLRRRR